MIKRSVLPVLLLLCAAFMTAHGGAGTGGAEPQPSVVIEELAPGQFVIGGPAASEAPAKDGPAGPAPVMQEETAPAPKERRIELIAATAVAEGQTETEWLKLVQNEANLLSEGRLLIDLHPAASLGQADRLIQRAQDGEIDLIALPLESLEKTVPELSALRTPMLFTGAPDETVLSVLNGDNAAVQALKQAFAQKGLVLLGMLPGSRTYTAVWGGATSFPKTAKGLRVAVENDAPTRSYWNALGAEPKRFDPKEIPAVLTNGAADALEGTPEALLAAGAAGEGFTLVPTDHELELTVLFIGAQTYAMLPESFKNELNGSVTDTLPPMLAQLTERENKALASLAGTGMAAYAGSVPHAESAAFEGLAKTVRALIEEAAAG